MKNLAMMGILIVVVIGGIFLFRGSKNQPTSQNTQNSQAEKQSGEISPHYVWYSPEELAQAQQKGRAVIYFWAAWCPTCRALNQELLQRSKELPDNVTILKTNYDTETALKKKYQIVTQHTLVQVDKDGNEVTKWIGGNVDVIKQELK